MLISMFLSDHVGICFICILVLDVGCIYIYNYYIFLMKWSPFHYIMTSLSYVIVLDVKPILSDISICQYLYPYSLLLTMWIEYLFLILYFLLLYVLKPKINLLEHIVGYCSFVHSTTLLNGVFNPFPFKVIISGKDLFYCFVNYVYTVW
jgi:hypothetical protein